MAHYTITDSDSVLTKLSKHLGNALVATGAFTHNKIINVERVATDKFDGYPAAVVLPYAMGGGRVSIQETKRSWTATVALWQEVDTKDMTEAQAKTSTQMAYDKMTDTIVTTVEAIDNYAELRNDPSTLIVGTSILRPFEQDITGSGVKLLALIEIDVDEVVDRD